MEHQEDSGGGVFWIASASYQSNAESSFSFWSVEGVKSEVAYWHSYARDNCSCEKTVLRNRMVVVCWKK